jgi:hypothetical protein
VNSRDFLICRAKHTVHHRPASSDQISPPGAKFASDNDNRFGDWVRVFITENNISKCEATVLMPLLETIRNRSTADSVAQFCALITTATTICEAKLMTGLLFADRVALTKA